MSQAPSPSDALLALHEQHRTYRSFAEFQPQLQSLLKEGELLDDCITLTRALGILEPITGNHIPPEALLIQGENWRESLIGNGLLSRSRALLSVLEQLYGSLEAIKEKDIYLVEAVTGFALWIRRYIGTDRVLCSEYLNDTEANFNDIPHQDLCELTLADNSLDIILCSDLFEHIKHLDRAFSEIYRVLRPGGRLIATCPIAFGQYESIIKALADPATGETRICGEPEMHGDPVRPEQGSLVYQIPGWDVLDQLKSTGMSDAKIHHIASWKYGILGSDLPGVLVIESKK